MSENLTIRNYSRIYIKQEDYISIIYSLFEDGLYVGSVKFNVNDQSCEIQNLLKDIPMKDIENCVCQQGLKEIESLKDVSYWNNFEILDNNSNDLQPKIHEWPKDLSSIEEGLFII